MDEHTPMKEAAALKYDQNEDVAPLLIAKGKGAIAEQLIGIAKAHDIEVREDKDLVKILSVLDVDSVIPLEAYAAVAEILSFIYQKDQEKRAKNDGS